MKVSWYFNFSCVFLATNRGILQSAASGSDSSDSDTGFPSNIHEMKPSMTQEEVNAKEIILEVNLTLLSFTIIVGFTGISSFLLGGIYSAVLTNNISHTTQRNTYPGALPVRNSVVLFPSTCIHSPH